MSAESKPHERAKIISVWIDIAQVRVDFSKKKNLKNDKTIIIMIMHIYLWLGVTDT